GALPSGGALAIQNTATVQLATGTGLETLSSLAIDPGAKLDIKNNHVILNYGATDPATTILAELKTGIAGSWTGPGIDSSTAGSGNYGVGFADGKDGIATG